MMNDSAYTSSGNQMAIPGNTPGSYSFEVTQTIDGCESESTHATLTIKEAPVPPLGKDTSLCEGDSVPALEAIGENISWYSEESPDHAIFTGNYYHTSDSLPGIYNYYISQHGADCESKTDTLIFEIRPRPGSPAVTQAEICEGEAAPNLLAEGVEIRWYSDLATQNFLNAGTELNPEKSEPGLYTFYATQTLSACESEARPVNLLIHPLPPQPQVENLDICDKEPLAELTATGENLSWYFDQALADLIYQGAVLQALTNDVGMQTYYVTQTLNSCEGPAAQLVLTINLIPEISLGEDTVLYTDETLILGPFPAEYSYLWNNATENAFLIIEGEDYGIGDHPVSVQVIYNGCFFRDSLTVAIEERVGINSPTGKAVHKIYPNPTEGDITLEFTSTISQDILVELYSSNGSIVQQFRHKDLPLNSRSSINIHLDTPGLYYLKIIEEDQVYNYPVIKL